MQTKLSRIFTSSVLFAASLALIHATAIANAAVLIAPSPDFPTIQSAVDAAASGDTISIPAGNYFEQIIISTPDLILEGATSTDSSPAAVLFPADTMNETVPNIDNSGSFFPIVAILYCNATIKNLAINGANLATNWPGLTGIHFFGAGGRVENCVITAFRAQSLSTSARANGVHSYNAAGLATPEVHVAIVNNTFADNLLSIQLRGDPAVPELRRVVFTVEGNTIAGPGPSPLPFDGIGLRNGAEGSIRRNVIKGFAYSGSDANRYASAIWGADGRARTRTYYAPLLPLLIEENQFVNNEDHLVLLAADNARISNNVFEGMISPRWGAIAVSGTNIFIENNNFADMPAGIFLFGDDDHQINMPKTGIAKDTIIIGNWFTNVSTVLRTNHLTTHQESATKTCCFVPTIGPAQLQNASITSQVRAWHATPLILESSTDFLNWTPIRTNILSSPVSQYDYPSNPQSPFEFFRLRQQP